MTIQEAYNVILYAANNNISFFRSLEDRAQEYPSINPVVIPFLRTFRLLYSALEECAKNNSQQALTTTRQLMTYLQEWKEIGDDTEPWFYRSLYRNAVPSDNDIWAKYMSAVEMTTEFATFEAQITAIRQDAMRPRDDDEEPSLNEWNTLDEEQLFRVRSIRALYEISLLALTNKLEIAVLQAASTENTIGIWYKYTRHVDSAA